MGGAIFHTGVLHLFHTTFVANEVGHEGAAILSMGFLEELSNVSFSSNMYFCRAGKYGYIDTDEVRSMSGNNYRDVHFRMSAGVGG